MLANQCPGQPPPVGQARLGAAGLYCPADQCSQVPAASRPSGIAVRMSRSPMAEGGISEVYTRTRCPEEAAVLSIAAGGAHRAHLCGRCGPCTPSCRQRSSGFHAQPVRARQSGDPGVESWRHRRHRQQRLPVGRRQKLRRVVAHCTRATQLALPPCAATLRGKHPRFLGSGTELCTCDHTVMWATSKAVHSVLTCRLASHLGGG